MVSDVIIVWRLHLADYRHSWRFAALEIDLSLSLVEMINVVLMVEGLLPYVLTLEDLVQDALGVA